MTASFSSLRAFLSNAKASIGNATKAKSKLSIVVGNESADLDSITSSILFAYFRSVAANRAGRPRLYVPLLNIPTADIKIRPELTTLLPHANVEQSHLITLDDLPEKLDAEQTEWLLVDHNALQGRLGKLYGHRVTGCIDHHVDEHKVPEGNEEEPRIITKAGSCTSLVINHFRDTWDQLSSSSSASNTAQGQGDAVVGSDDEAVRRTWDAQIAKLALASILIDTHDLTSEDKVTKHDTKAVKYLESKIYLAPGQAGRFDRSTFFNQLSYAKKDLDGLSVNDVLRKDYKEWKENGKLLGVSSVVKPLSYLQDKAGEHFHQELEAFATKRDLSILAIMTTSSSEKGEFERELLLRILDPASVGFLTKLENEKSQDLKLEEFATVEVQGKDQKPTKIWWQRDTSKSRKQVAPLMREILGKL